MNERESTGDGGEKNLLFFFSRKNRRIISKKQSKKEKIIYSRTIAREKEKVSVSIYFPCFSTLRFFVGGHGGRKRLFTPTLSRLRNAAAVINYPGKSCNDPDIPSISQGGRGSSAIRPIGVSWENRVIDKRGNRGQLFVSAARAFCSNSRCSPSLSRIVRIYGERARRNGGLTLPTRPPTRIPTEFRVAKDTSRYTK